MRNALLGKTLAFSGSSRIAYGPAFAPVGLADIIALDFLSVTKRGDCFGDAFSLARLAVLGTEVPTPHDLLTYVEFNLFGDPTLTLPAVQCASSTQGNSYAKSSTVGVGKSALSPRNPLSSVRAVCSAVPNFTFACRFRQCKSKLGCCPENKCRWCQYYDAQPPKGWRLGVPRSLYL